MLNFHKFCLILALQTTAIEAIAQYPQLNNDQKIWLGELIFNNECSQRSECLTAWNPGENFPSLGIGHFIWYRNGQQEVFEESFPQLISFLESHSIQVPDWIPAAEYDAPWQNRDQFLDELEKPNLQELRRFLQQNILLQTEFIIQRFEQALDKILDVIPKESLPIIEERFLKIANASPPYGLYALIDYVNFKGRGTAREERYQNEGWGLLQVLENMPENNKEPLRQFVNSAMQILERRVKNAPKERQEERWLSGWLKRLMTYLPETGE